MARKKPGDVGALLTHLSAEESRWFDEVRRRLDDGGRVGAYPRTLLMRVAVFAAAKGVGLVEAFDAVTVPAARGDIEEPAA